MHVWRFSGQRRSFALVLAAISVALLFQMAAPDEEWARLLTIVLQAAVVLIALGVAGAGDALMRIATFAFLMVIAISIGSLFTPGEIAPAIPRLISLALVLLAPIAIAIGLRAEIAEQERVTLETVYAALCLYLLLGLAFGFVYGLVENIGDQPFFAAFGDRDPTSNDFLYFSLSTLTTTGYGDFTAGTEFGRAVSITEALAGQMYLVTVIALLVSNLGRPRPGRRGRRAAGEQTPPAGDAGP